MSIPSWVYDLNYENAYERYSKHPINNCLSVYNGWYVSFIELDDEGNQYEESYLVNTKHSARYYRYRSLWYVIVILSPYNISIWSVLSNGQKVYLNNNIDKDPMLLINRLIDEYGQSIDNTSKSSRFI